MKKKLYLLITFLAIFSLGIYSQDNTSDNQSNAKSKHKFEKMDIEGKITKLYEFPMMSGYSFKLAANVMVDKDEYTVFLGPKWIFESLKVNLKVDDQVKISGIRYSMNGKYFFIATELTKGDQVVTLPHKPMKKKHSFNHGQK